VVPGSITLKSGSESLSFYDGGITGLGSARGSF